MIRQIGKHKIRHGDVMEDLGLLMGENKVDIFYSDPPWGSGNLRYWQTMNTKMNGVDKKEINYWAFINRIIEVAVKYTTEDSIIFIEYGKRFTKDVIEMAEQKGLILIEVIEMVYSSENLPLDLIILSKKPITVSKEYIDSVYHTKGLDSLRNAIKPFVFKGAKIMDPCCGMGYTAQFAIDNGLTFFGNEINLKRLQKTIARLEGDKND